MPFSNLLLHKFVGGNHASHVNIFLSINNCMFSYHDLCFYVSKKVCPLTDLYFSVTMTAYLYFSVTMKAYLYFSVTMTAHVPVGSLSVYWNFVLTPASRALFSMIFPNSSLLMQPKNVVALGTPDNHCSQSRKISSY